MEFANTIVNVDDFRQQFPRDYEQHLVSDGNRGGNNRETTVKFS